MRTPVTVGVVGGSPRVAALVETIERLPQAELRWLCSDRRGLVPRRGVRRTTRVAELLADDRLDAVLVAATAGVAHELTAAAIEADKHVYVAGVPAQQSAQAEQLVRTARRRDRCLFVADVHSFEPCCAKLAELVQTAELGDVLYAQGERLVGADADLLWDVAPEDIALVLRVLGDEPVAVAAQGESYLDLSSPDLLDIRLEFATGIVARLTLSGLDARSGSRYTVVGTRATAVVDPEASPALAVHAKDGADVPAVVCPRLAAEDPVRKSCEVFLAAVRSVDGAAPHRHAVAVVEVLEQVERSLKRAAAHRVAPELRVVPAAAGTQPA